MATEAGWINGLLVLFGTGLGGVLVALIQKHRTPEDRHAVKATAKATEMDVLGSTLSKITTTLGQEIERLQDDAAQVRERVVLIETELRAARQRVADLERQLLEAKADLDRVRGDRDHWQEVAVQAQGEVRQLKAVADARTRVESET